MIWKNCKDLSFNQYNHFNLGSLIEDIGVLWIEKIGVYAIKI